MCKDCRECGKRLNDVKKGALFCSATCRKTYNNRRMIRGAELYDMYMAMAYERETRKELDLFTTINRMARAYRDSDKHLRDGRKSWNVRETLDRLPIAFGTEGDKR